MSKEALLSGIIVLDFPFIMAMMTSKRALRPQPDCDPRPSGSVFRGPVPIAPMPSRLATAVGCVFGVGLLLGAVGCDKPIDIPPLEVKAVDAYGMRLDEQATPQQVAYALLRSIRDDFNAAQAHDREKQKDAFRVTFSLAAFRAINAQLEDAEQGLPSEKPAQASGFSRERAIRIHSVIHHWTPIFSHYVRSFDADAQGLMSRMIVAVDQDGQRADVHLDAVHDPAAPDADEHKVRLHITLAKESADSGQASYWRVARVGFLGLPGQSATQSAPAGGPGPSS